MNKRAQRRSEKLRGYSRACIDWWSLGRSGKWYPTSRQNILVGTFAFATYNDAWRWLEAEFPEEEFYAYRRTGYMVWPRPIAAAALMERMLKELEGASR